MAKSVKIITTSFVQIAAGAAVMTIKKVGKGNILFDEASNEDTALVKNGQSALNKQIHQSEAKPTFCKADNDGFEVIVDE